MPIHINFSLLNRQITEQVPPFKHGYELHGSNKVVDCKFNITLNEFIHN